MKTTLEITHSLEITIIAAPCCLIVLVEESLEIVETVELVIDVDTSLILSQEVLA
jgi:hypothetical protein